MHILDFIRLIRESFEGSEYVYQNGSCYWFARILKAVYPPGELWEFPHEHVIFKLDGRFYDIRGEVQTEGRDITPSKEPTPHGKFSLIDFIILCERRKP
jgi:hypothetical protein